jgi:hypothetical protein
MFYFILLKIRTFPLPSPHLITTLSKRRGSKRGAIELSVEEVLFQLIGHYSYPITY